MKDEEIYDKVVAKKEYVVFPKDLVLEIVAKNRNKKEPVKEVRKRLRKISIMYRDILRTDSETRELFSFISRETGIKSARIIDLGCGRMPEKLGIIGQVIRIDDYVGVDVYPSSRKVIQDNITSPKKGWKKRHYDLALLLNVIPILDKEKKALEAISFAESISDFVVLTLPTQSLTGKKSIRGYWEKWAQENIKEPYSKKIMKKELAIIIKPHKVY